MERKNIEEIDRLYPHRFPDTCGSEAVVFYLDDFVYKEFVIGTSMDTLKRKEKKLLELSKLEHLQPYYPEILCLITSLIDEYIRGYIMKPVYDKSITRESLSFNLKIKALENLRKILEKFKNSGYLYLDIRTPNIKVDNEGNPTLLDIDSILEINNPVFDCTPTDIRKYIENGGQINPNTQIFMFNIFTQEVLELNQYAIEETGAKIISDLSSYTPDSTCDHEYLIDYIKRR